MKYPRLSLVLLGLLAGFFIAEVGLRIYLAPRNVYYVWPSGLEKILQPDSTIFPGIRGNARFRVNSNGIRGPEFTAKDHVRILALGGSTTECVYLDEGETWPDILANHLQSARPDLTIWVGNLGASGKNMRDHLFHVRYLLPQMNNIDHIIILSGLNDFLLRLNRGNAYREDFLATSEGQRYQYQHAFVFTPIPLWPFDGKRIFYKNSALWYTARLAWIETFPMGTHGLYQDPGGQYLQVARETRFRSPKLDILPDLESALREYRRNLNTVIDLLQKQNVKPLFLTHPVLWKTEMPDAEERLLWMGWQKNINGNTTDYYDAAALTKGMVEYNQTLLAVCRERKVPVIDLAAIVPSDLTTFYDDVHFNETGAKQIGEILSEYFLNEGQLLPALEGKR